jgi:hypothetical protein
MALPAAFSTFGGQDVRQLYLRSGNCPQASSQTGRPLSLPHIECQSEFIPFPSRYTY